jgi:hypothetical protein
MPEPGELHGHKCGWSPTDEIHMHGRGCGHVFAHHAPMGVVSDELYDRNHACPNCGRGPWKAVWFPGVEEDWNSMSEEEQEGIRQVVRLKRLVAALGATFLSVGDDDAEQEIQQAD